MCQLLLSGVGYVPTPNVHSDVWNSVESYMIYMLLACRLKITFTLSLRLINSFLVQLQHLPLPSLIVTSSQVRVGTPLPLWSCSIPGLGPEGLQHNRTFAWRSQQPKSTVTPSSYHSKLIAGSICVTLKNVWIFWVGQDSCYRSLHVIECSLIDRIPELGHTLASLIWLLWSDHTWGESGKQWFCLAQWSQ